MDDIFPKTKCPSGSTLNAETSSQTWTGEKLGWGFAFIRFQRWHTSITAPGFFYLGFFSRIGGAYFTNTLLRDDLNYWVKFINASSSMTVYNPRQLRGATRVLSANSKFARTLPVLLICMRAVTAKGFPHSVSDDYAMMWDNFSHVISPTKINSSPTNDKYLTDKMLLSVSNR